MAGHDLGIVFHILADLENRGILKHRFQHRKCRVEIHLALGQGIRSKKIVAACLGLVGEGDIAGFARLNAKGYTYQIGGHFIEAGGLGVKGNPAAAPDPVDPDLQRLGIAHAFVFFGVERHGLCRIVLCCRSGGSGGIGDHRRFAAHLLGHPGAEGAELHLGQEIQYRIRIGFAQFQIIKRKVERHVAVQLH